MPRQFLLRKDSMQPSRALKVLLVGHACSPGLGSEPGFTWNWAWFLSVYHQVWVLAHPHYRDNVERSLREHPNTNLHFVWVTLPRWKDPWNPARGEQGIRLHYVLWQRAALRQAWRLHARHGFDLIHHVSWGTIGAPPPLGQLRVPFVWGPVGGGQTSPAAFGRYFGSNRWQEQIRSLHIGISPWLPSLRSAVRHCALPLATNHETACVLQKAGAQRVQLFLDTGLAPEYLPATPPKRGAEDGLTLLWAGRFEPRKALPLALEALCQAGEPAVRLLVAGDGPRRQAWQELAQRLGVEGQVRFLGFLSREGMRRVFRQADAFLFTSLRDSFGSVMLEAMAHALPILTLDHQGARLFVPPEAGIKAAVSAPAETVAALAQGIRQLARSPETRWKMGEAAWAYARTQTWDRRAAQMSRWYHECLSR